MSSTPGWHRVGAPQRPQLIVNPSSGQGAAMRHSVADHARDRGFGVEVLDRSVDLRTVVADAVRAGADALAMAGGDGSLSVVAAAALAHDLPFAVIPTGTRNHFALDLGVDRRDPVGALDAFVDGVERAVDVAYVNGRLFLNNVSLGIYGDAVREPAYRDAKLRTLLATAQRVLGPSGEAPQLEVVDDRGRRHASPLVVLVSNNPYAIGKPLVEGTRPTLAGGRLGVVVIDAPGGRAPGRAWSAKTLRVDAPSAVAAGIDGEAVELAPPLEFTIAPGALRVRISARHPGVSPSGALP